MDLLSLRDLPLALAFGIVCLWLYNQGNLEHAKRLVALTDSFSKEFNNVISNYESLLNTVLEERRQGLADQRAEREILLNRLNSNTEAMTKNASETHQLRSSLTPISILVEQINREQGGTRRASKPRDDTRS